MCFDKNKREHSKEGKSPSKLNKASFIVNHLSWHPDDKCGSATLAGFLFVFVVFHTCLTVFSGCPYQNDPHDILWLHFREQLS